MHGRLESVEREMERASTLIVCEDGQKLQRSSLEDLQRVLPVLVRRYHSVRVEKDKLLQAFQALSKEAKRMPGGSGRDTHAQEMYQARWAPRAHRHCHGPCDYAGLKTEVVKLEKALLAQSAFIQTLQSRQTKVESYKTTIKVQAHRMLSCVLQQPCRSRCRPSVRAARCDLTDAGEGDPSAREPARGEDQACRYR